MSSRPDGFVLGQDPEAGKEEKVEGCATCGRTWPAVRFSKAVAEDPTGESGKPIVCDSCQDKEATAELAAKIDEAQGIATALGPTRYVEVEGIESKSNVIKFKYATHLGGEELKMTTLTVWFKGNNKRTPVEGQGDFIQAEPCYRYFEVPTAVCEGWFAAPAHGQSYGSFFAEQIRKSYQSERTA